MPAISHRVPTGTVVKAIHDLVAAVLMPDGQWGAGTPSAMKALDRVELFDSEQLEEAFRYLLISEQRVAVIVPMAEHFEPVFQAQKLTVKRELPVMVLISDRVFGDRKSALLGNNDTPGATGLVELVLPGLTGILVVAAGGLGAVISEPMSSAVMMVHDPKGNLPNRVCMGLELRCRGGYLEAPLPRGGIL